MAKHLSVEEKIELVEKYHESGKTIQEFCKEQGISRSGFYRLIKEYGTTNIEEHLSEQDHLRREKELQKEILKLKIENERLKKNYIVQKREDGKTEYIRLRTMNTKS